MALCSRHPAPAFDPECYRCKLVSLDLRFTYGKDQFHGPTLKERSDKIVTDYKAKNNGKSPVPVGTRWV